MYDIKIIIIYTLCAGACIPIGGLIAHAERIKPAWLENEFRHFVIAFGGGILLAAVALVLLPEGSGYINNPVSSAMFVLMGGVCFFILERFLGVRRRERPQLIAMLLDYVPESLALGGAFAINAKFAPLLAIFIGLQNLPEGFNAYRELHAVPKTNGRDILGFMFFLVPIGPILAVIGWFYFADNAWIIGATMLFASGGILYLIFQDIAPQSHMKHHWSPPLGAVSGFCLGMLGKNMMIGI